MFRPIPARPAIGWPRLAAGVKPAEIECLVGLLLEPDTKAIRH